VYIHESAVGKEAHYRPKVQRLSVRWFTGCRPNSPYIAIRDAAHAAIRQGEEASLNRAPDETGLSAEAKKVIRGGVRAGAQTPI
jgi:hypothetical protein